MPLARMKFRYLSQAQLLGFSKYKYSCIDTSPLSNYVMHPFWNAVVKLVPRWVAPNVLTFSGWLMLMVIFGILSYYDWDYYTSNNPDREPIPRWVWLVAAILHFLSHTLDGIDGKQARRTGSSSPLGELFDHGLDSIAAVLLPMCSFSFVGRSPWGGEPDQAFIVCLACLAGFFLSHWEKYITGILYLPWFYDIMQLGFTLAYALNFIYGEELWHFYTIPGLSAAHTFRWILIFSFIGSIPFSFWNIYDYYRRTSSTEGSPEAPPPRRLSFLEALAPWTPAALLSFLFAAWVYLSPTDIISREPRILVFAVGIAFSNITCRLIISQMSGQPCEIYNHLLTPLAIAVAGSILYPAYEHLILYSYAAVIILAHIHYGVCVVQELCEHLNIYCFFIKAQPSSNDSAHDHSDAS